uniref:NADH-ubiquinone oxidoreductase chain 6 n=1 Tax=Notocochlis gualtieriana TaxID=2671062 RepID=A0A6G6D651_9CAEN|nr:NADH dehydrogenase subunit 6 [Notocochlis gualtieriana]QIE12003.1 NADH dehydrogenase subunit 6 [Notocochlis gualtieriana]
MTSLLILSFAASSVFMFPLMAQPLSLGLSIMISTFLLCSVTAMLISSWYAYILFLIYVGGLLVMFAYVSALSPNVLFSGMSSVILFFIFSMVFMSLLYFYPFSDLSSILYNSSYTEMKQLKMYGGQLVSPQNVSILIGLGIILLINLIVVVKICYYQQSPLRPFTKNMYA